MKTALLIIDMQNVFGHQMDAPLPNIKKLHAYFQSRSWPVIFTQHGHTPDELTPPIKNQLILKEGADSVIMVDSDDWQFTPDVWKIVESAPVVAKNTYDAFRSGELEKLLQAQNVQRVVITGVMTDVCCHTTAVSAFTRDYGSWLVSDACGTESVEQHEMALKSAEFLMGNVLGTEEVISRLEKENDDVS